MGLHGLFVYNCMVTEFATTITNLEMFLRKKIIHRLSLLTVHFLVNSRSQQYVAILWIVAWNKQIWRNLTPLPKYGFLNSSPTLLLIFTPAVHKPKCPCLAWTISKLLLVLSEQSPIHFFCNRPPLIALLFRGQFQPFSIPLPPNMFSKLWEWQTSIEFPSTQWVLATTGGMGHPIQPLIIV